MAGFCACEEANVSEAVMTLPLELTTTKPTLLSALLVVVAIAKILLAIASACTIPIGLAESPIGAK